MSRVNDGCYDGIWILYSAGRPCLNPMICGRFGPDVSVLAGSYAIVEALSRQDVKQGANILRIFRDATLFPIVGFLP